jgi:hypothetical protein
LQVIAPAWVTLLSRATRLVGAQALGTFYSLWPTRYCSNSLRCLRDIALILRFDVALD